MTWRGAKAVESSERAGPDKRAVNTQTPANLVANRSYSTARACAALAVALISEAGWPQGRPYKATAGQSIWRVCPIRALGIFQRRSRRRASRAMATSSLDALILVALRFREKYAAP